MRTGCGTKLSGLRDRHELRLLATRCWCSFCGQLAVARVPRHAWHGAAMPLPLCSNHLGRRLARSAWARQDRYPLRVFMADPQRFLPEFLRTQPSFSEVDG